MRFTYRITQSRSGFIAECMESEAAGEGPTADEAIASLRKELEERMFRPDAVAPPPETTESPIELVPMEEPVARPSLDLGGPGDAPLR